MMIKAIFTYVVYRVLQKESLGLLRIPYRELDTLPPLLLTLGTIVLYDL